MPIEVSSPDDADRQDPGGDHHDTPVMIVVIQGVRNRGWIFATTGGSRPSCAIEKKIRGWLRSMTRITEVSPAIAPSLTIAESQFSPMASIADGDRVGDVEQLVVDDPGHARAPPRM